jgi:uncharacterized membrane protein YkvA (DUF1232 family)
VGLPDDLGAIALAAGATLALYALAVAALVFTGRRSGARELARLIPDCLVLLKRLLRDPRVAGWRKAAVAGLIAYLAMPIDLVPDFIPVAGQLDDVLVLAIALRVLVCGSGSELVREHWPGSPRALAVLVR